MMKRFWVVLFMVGCLYSFSQEKDSTEVPKHIYFFKQNEFNTGDTSFSTIDTSLDYIQIYTNRNNLGNNGLPHVSFTPSLLPELEFNYAPHLLSRYGFSSSHVKYYNTTAPYTQISYVLGAKREQDLKVIHTQNINRYLNFAANFNRVRSDGFYQRQNTNNNAFNISSNYKSPGQRYCLLSNLIYNGLRYAENGGVSDTSFVNAGNGDKSIVPVNLALAQQKIRERSFYAKQYINIGNKIEEKINDTTTVKKLIPKSSISHSLLVSDNYRLYTDNETMGSSYYSNFYSDTATTVDSLYYWRVQNELMWETIKIEDRRQKLGGSLGVKHELVELRQYTTHQDSVRTNVLDTSFNSVIVKGRLFNYGTDTKFLFDVYGKYIVNGYSKNGYDAGLTLKQLVGSNSNYVQFKAVMKNQLPDFIYQRYYSNHFAWTANFNTVMFQSLDLRFVSKKLFLEAGGSFLQYNRFVYLDPSVMPKQFNQAFTIVSAFVNKDFHFNKLTLSNKIIYQRALDSSVVRIPALVTCHSIFFSFDIFKKALHTNIGFDVFYNSFYYANTYMPGVGQFYLQNSKQIGNYPYIDFFLSLQIKTARIFFKYEHLNAGFMGNIYYAAPNYPMPDAAFKFGINWRVFN